jgi:hypothetical protein
MSGARSWTLALAVALAGCSGVIPDQSRGAAQGDSPSDPGSKPMSGSPDDPGPGKDPPIGAMPPSSPGSGAGGTNGFILPDAGAADAAAPGAAADAAGSGSDPSASPPCSVMITPVLPPRLLDLLAGDGQRLRVHAGATGREAPAMPTWKWSVLHESAGNVAVTVVDGDPGTIELGLALPGRYDIRAEATATCVGTVSATAMLPAMRATMVRVRVTPPHGNVLPPQETRVEVLPGRVATKDIALAMGKSVSIEPVDGRPGSTMMLASYIRISSAGSAIRFEGYTGSSPFVAALDPLLRYDILVVPDGSAAPALFTSLLPSEFATQTFSFDQGTPIDGKVLAAAGGGAPVEDARVLLRAGSLPSTLGRSSADGRFTLNARPGAFTALVVPPLDRGLPDAHLPQGASIAVGAAPIDLTFQYRSLPSQRLDVQVTDASGAAPAMPVRVRVESEPGALDDVGTFTIGSGQEVHATGSVRLEATTNAGGFASFPRAPTTRYHVTALPPLGANGFAITEGTLDASDANPHKLALAAAVPLTASLSPPALAAGLKVVAVDTSPSPGEPLTTTVDTQGRFTLPASPGRMYRLYTEPAPDKRLPRLLLGLAKGGGGPLALTLPGTVAVLGRITNGLVAVPGAVIEVFCTGPTPDCLGDQAGPNADAARPVNETVTDADGRYQLYVPDPAQWNL